MPRRRKVGGIAFMVVWMVFWTAAILIAVYTLGAEALDGEIAPALFLLVWIGFALFGLSRAARTLVGMLAGKAGPSRLRGRHHHWEDGVAGTGVRTDDRAPPPLPPEAHTADWTQVPRVAGRQRGGLPPEA